jgi:hypothetical protein
MRSGLVIRLSARERNLLESTAFSKLIECVRLSQCDASVIVKSSYRRAMTASARRARDGLHLRSKSKSRSADLGSHSPYIALPPRFQYASDGLNSASRCEQEILVHFKVQLHAPVLSAALLYLRILPNQLGATREHLRPRQQINCVITA